jgi:hypothetical protein
MPKFLTQVDLPEPLPFSEGGHEGSTVVEARTNLDVYSKSEADVKIAAASGTFGDPAGTAVAMAIVMGG